MAFIVSKKTVGLSEKSTDCPSIELTCLRFQSTEGLR
jgi:hypothetical protein